MFISVFAIQQAKYFPIFKVLYRYLSATAQIQKLFMPYNIPFNLNHGNLDDTKILHFVDHMRKKYITYWEHPLQKLEFYSLTLYTIDLS